MVTYDYSVDCVTNSVEQSCSQGAYGLSAGQIPHLMCQYVYTLNV